MGYNKIPLALRFDDSTGNADGLIEFQLNVSDIGDICEDGYNPQPGDVLTYNDALDCWTASAPPAGGGGGAVNSVNTQTGNVSLYLSSLSGVDTSDLQGDHHIVYDDATNNWTSQYSQKLFVIASNQTGSDLLRGAVVYVSDVTIGGDPEVSLARADSADTMPSIGVVAERIPSTETGPVISFGTALGLTFDSAPTGADVGKTVYVSPTNAGQVTVTKPTNANHLIQNVGILVDDSPVKVKVTGVGRANDVPNSATFTGDITLNGGDIVMTGSETVDGRDLSVDGAKLDGIEDFADVTDATNVAAAGALMDSNNTVTPTNLDSTINAQYDIPYRSVTGDTFTHTTATSQSVTFLGTQANLGDLTNVNADDASDGYILEYDSTAEIPWVAVSPTTGFLTNNGIVNTFHTSGGDPLVRLDASDASASLTEAYTFTIPSGTLGDYKDVEIDYYGRHLNNAGTGGNLRVAFIMGGVGIFNSQTSQGTGTNPMRWHLKIKLASMTGNKYHVFLNWTQGAQSFATSGQGNIGSMHREGVMHSEATLTSTVDNDIRFEIRHESFASVTEKYFTIDSVRAVALPAVVGAE